ncbi:MAG TPA: CorA family divalent cation transporter, partial [Candidatus Limnocylindrales bacterium]
MSAGNRQSVGLRVRLYDAAGRDREVPIKDRLAREIGDRQLLWIDLDGRNHEDLRAVAGAVELEPALVRLLGTAPERADMTSYPEHVHLILQSMESDEPAARDPGTLTRRPIDLVAGRNWVVTVHDGPVRAFERIDASTEGESRLGALDAAGFLASIADEVLADYLELAEGIEQEIDHLDELALRRRSEENVLVRIVALRRRIGVIRRTLAPHRVAFAAFARPEMELYKDLGKPWPGLTEHLDRTLEAIENLRELLLGTFDILMGRQGQSANEVMKVLTILSAVLL